MCYYLKLEVDNCVQVLCLTGSCCASGENCWRQGFGCADQQCRHFRGSGPSSRYVSYTGLALANLSTVSLAKAFNVLSLACYSACLTDKFNTHMCRPDEKLKLTFMTNAVGPIIAYKYFKSLLDKGDTKMIINFASNYGSITLASEPLKDPSKATPLDHTQIAYKASKAAVNMGMFADGLSTFLSYVLCFT
jgi:hypothetical protein